VRDINCFFCYNYRIVYKRGKGQVLCAAGNKARLSLNNRLVYCPDYFIECNSCGKEVEEDDFTAMTGSPRAGIYHNKCFDEVNRKFNEKHGYISRG